MLETKVTDNFVCFFFLDWLILLKEYLRILIV